MTLDTRERIIAAALQTLAKNPLATLDQVAEAAGLGRATLFRHFPNKKMLMRTLSFEAHRCCMDALAPLTSGEGSPHAKLARAIEALVPMGAAFHFLTYEPWHTGDDDLERDHQRYLEHWSALLAEVRASGGVAPDLPEYWVTNALDALLYAAWEGIHAGEIAPRQAAKLVLRSFLHGVEPDTAPVGNKETGHAG